MSTGAVRIPEEVEAYRESLTERMGRGRLPVAEAVRHATQIATSLRDLHVHGLVYGAVSSQLILLGKSGATLRSGGGLTHFGEGHRDVTAFGAVLGEMLDKVDGPEELREEIRRLAVRCREEAPDMRQVLIILRLLALRTRQAVTLVRGPVLVQSPAEAPKREWNHAVLHLAQMARHWKPLANLAAFALSGK